ncbi:MAG: carbohydrate ABC transporter permease, partial [Clostridiales bacterium]|nr:carbohydrate ABC transporter permease [Clostridiales bacterium]
MDRVKALGRAALDRRNLRIQAQRGQKAALYLLAAVILLGISFVILSPLISMVSQSFMTLADRYNPLVYIVPMEVTLQNFQNAYKYLQYPLSVLTTLSYSALMTALQVAVTAAAGYGFARFPFPGRRLLFGLVILTIVVPVQTIMVPLYAQFRYFDVLGLFKLLTGRPVNLLDTPLPMTLLNLTGVGLRSGLFIYIFRQY